MNNSSTNQEAFAEVNLHDFLKKIWKKKWLFVSSVVLCIALAYAYIKQANPVFEVNTKLLIDPTGGSRMLSESKYVEGGVGLIEVEKNLFNEMNIIQSFTLIEKTIEELNFDVSYYSADWYKRTEHYRNFPVRVEFSDSCKQIVDVPITIDILDEERFILSVDVKEFHLADRDQATKSKHEKPFTYSTVHEFGVPVEHQYFCFTVFHGNRPLFDDEYQDKELQFELHHLQDVASRYKSALEVEQVDIQASVLGLSSKGEVVQKEIDFQNKLMRNYIQSKLSERDAIASSKEAFIREQLLNISDSLAQAERSLQRFRQRANAIDLTHTASRTLDQIQDLQSAQAQTELNIRYYESLLTYLTDVEGVNKIIAPSVVGIEDALLNETLLELKRLKGEETRMELLQGSKSYDLEILQQQIDNTTESLRENISNLIGSSNLTLNDLNNRIARLELTMNRLPRSEKELVNFQRRSNLYENLYNYLSQELAKTGIARAEDVPDTRILDAPRMTGTGPVTPKKKMILALGFLIGLFVPFGYITMIPAHDDFFKDASELEKITTIPLLASIVRDSAKVDLMTTENPNWQAKESFRDLSANLQFLVNSRQKNVIGFTSTVPGEGKTFCASHLALNLASAGHRVLLIDTDFRNPSLSRQLEKKKGLAFNNYLRGWISDPRDVLQPHSKYRNLEYITATRADRNPHNLLSSPKFEYLLIELRDEYDFIIFDCPAVGLVSDYLIISRLIDVHLFVLRHRKSKYSFVSEFEKLKDKGNLENLYFVFNDVPPKKFKYGYFSYDEGQGETSQKQALRRVSM